MKSEYKLTNGDIRKKPNAEHNLGLGFENSFKACDYNLSIVCRANGIIGWKG